MNCLATILGVVGLMCCVKENLCAQTFTVNAGKWSSPSTWSTGVVPDYSQGTITINHAVTIQDTVLTIDEVVVNAPLTIADDAIVTISYSGVAVADLMVQAGSIDVFGKLICNNLVVTQTNALNTTFHNESVYEHRYSTMSGEPPIATWYENSTVLITGYITSRSLNTIGWQQFFGNVTYNCAQQSESSYVEMLGNVRNIAGNFRVQNTNGGVLRLTRSQGQLRSIDIAGDFIIEGKSEVWISYEGTTRVNVAGNFEFRSTSGGASYITTSGNSELNVGGNVLINSNAAFRLASSGGGTGIFRVAGNMLMTTGRLAVETPGIGILEFTGNEKQTISLMNDLPNSITLINNNPTEVEILTDDKIIGSVQTNKGRLILPDNFSLYGDLVAGEQSSIRYPAILPIIGTTNQQLDLHGDTVANVVIAKPEASNVTLNSALNLEGYLHIQSSNTDVVTNGNLTLLSQSDDGNHDASIYTLPGGSEVIGDVHVQRYMAGEGRIYRYISIPVNNAAVANLQDDFAITGTFTDPSTGSGINKSAPSFFYYDESLEGTLGWTPYPKTGLANEAPLIPGLGYAAFIRTATDATVWDVTGSINQGEISLPVQFHNHNDINNDGWNLVGNPYPAAVDWDAIDGWEKINVETGIYVRENGTKQFLFWDGDIGNLGSGRIAKGQSFWVKTSGVAPVLKIKETAKATTPTPFYREAVDVIDYLEITLSTPNMQDKTYLRLRPDAFVGYDNKDIIKRMNDELNVAVVQDQTSMAIAATNKIDCDHPINLHVGYASNQMLPVGQYSFQFERFGVFRLHNIMLLDRYTNDTISITSSGYMFWITDETASKQDDRFQLIVEAAKLPATFSVSHDEIFCGETPYAIHLNQLPANWIFTILNGEDERTEHSSGSATQVVEFNMTDFKQDSVHTELIIQQACDNTSHTWVTTRFENPKIIEVSGTLYSSGTNNQWYVEGHQIEGANEQYFTPAHSGLFSVRSKNGSCEAFAYYDFIFQEQYPIVFPNPASKSMTCLAPANALIVNYALTDSFGRLIISEQLQEHSKQLQMNIESLESGMYVIHMQTTSGCYALKVVKP